MFEVSRQRRNMGPVQRIYVESKAEAQRAFDMAVADGDQFVEIFNVGRQTQENVYIAPAQWVS